jgi:predicted AlkP superfamily phosphohydrolase/phosphomutase
MDEAGYLRVNLRGRERDGIVDPGPAYDDVCDDIDRLVASLCDEATGQPIAGRARRAYNEAETGLPSRRLVPDLVFPWTGPTAASTRRLVSTALPGFKFDVPDRIPSGRSGNHTSRGWFIASGPGVRMGADVDGHDVVDLLPTILASLGREPDPRLPGQAIAEIARQ